METTEETVQHMNIELDRKHASFPTFLALAYKFWVSFDAKSLSIYTEETKRYQSGTSRQKHEVPRKAIGRMRKIMKSRLQHLYCWGYSCYTIRWSELPNSICSIPGPESIGNGRVVSLTRCASFFETMLNMGLLDVFDSPIVDHFRLCSTLRDSQPRILKHVILIDGRPFTVYLP